MNILPSSGIASLAGTARAQVHGTDADRRSPSADAAVDSRVAEVAGLEAGQKSQDRDADGRQLLEQRSDEKADARDENPHDESSRDENLHDEIPRDESSHEGAGTHIDFEA